jgi:hypothetical protein
MQIDFECAFEAIAGAMVRAAQDCSFSNASTEAERNGLIEQGDGKSSQLQVWERSEKRQYASISMALVRSIESLFDPT